RGIDEAGSLRIDLGGSRDRTGGALMSIRLQNQAWREVKTDTAAEMLLLIACTDIADDEGNSIWASDEYLSWKTGISLRTIQAIKKKWREAGVLIPRGLFNLETKEQVFQDDMDVSRGTGGRGWVVLYQVRLGALAAKTPWKVATAATFTEGRKDHVERSQPEAQKVATAAQEGRNLAQRNKEDPSVDPSGNPLGERGVKTAIADALAVKSPPFQDSFTGKNKTKKPEHPELEACCKVLWQDFIGANPEEKLDWHRGVEGPVKKLLAEIPSMTAAKLKEYCANRRTTPGTRQAELPKLYLWFITN